MKKIIFLSLLLMGVAGIAGAQHPLVTNTVPRFGTTPNNDNTGRALTWGYQPFTYPSGGTLNVLTNYYDNYIQETDVLTGALTVQIDTNGQYVPATAYTPAYFVPYKNVYVGDKVEFQFTANSSNETVTFGFGFKAPSSNAITVTASQTADVTFIFDSSGEWRELSSVIE